MILAYTMYGTVMGGYARARNLIRPAVAAVEVHTRTVEVPHIQAVVVLLKLPSLVRPLLAHLWFES